MIELYPKARVSPLASPMWWSLPSNIIGRGKSCDVTSGLPEGCWEPPTSKVRWPGNPIASPLFLLLFLLLILQKKWLYLPSVFSFPSFPPPAATPRENSASVTECWLSQAQCMVGEPIITCGNPCFLYIYLPHYFLSFFSWQSPFSLFPSPSHPPTNHSFIYSPSSTMFIIYFMYTPPFSTMNTQNSLHHSLLSHFILCEVN